ncbi:MAG: 30S ribosomal protein S2 [Longimicrobiales bacterium]
MQEVGLNDLLEAGVHFGHQTRRWNPKMRKYIFTERNGIHIIDLRKTLDRLQAAQEAVRDVVHAGERVLFVCTKGQLRDIIETEAERCGSFYVTERWLGGMLTNFRTIKNQIRRLKEIERGQEENAFDFYTKKERLLLDRERQKLEKYLSGVKEMGRLPGAVFVVDAKREIIAVREANRLDIPVIAITDTNADPDLIDYPIPGNDDAIRSVSLIARAVATAIEVARSSVPEDERRLAEEMEATTYSTETGEVEVEERPRRKKKRKRVPRPEIIERRRRGSEEAGDDEREDLEEVDEPDVEEEGIVDAAPEEEEEPRAEAESETDEAEDEEVEDTEEKEG